MNTPITRILDPIRSFEEGKKYALISKNTYHEGTKARLVYTMVYIACMVIDGSRKEVCGYNRTGNLELDLIQDQYWWYKVPDDFPFYNGRKLILHV